jgi:hypothetical protein
MLDRFAEPVTGTFVWTRATDGTYHLGRIVEAWRYDASAAARVAGIPHVRPTRWLQHTFTGDKVPAAVSATFARGGRNLQRIRDTRAESDTEEIWMLWEGPRR